MVAPRFTDRETETRRGQVTSLVVRYVVAETSRKPVLTPSCWRALQWWSVVAE